METHEKRILINNQAQAWAAREAILARIKACNASSYVYNDASYAVAYNEPQDFYDVCLANLSWLHKLSIATATELDAPNAEHVADVYRCNALTSLYLPNVKRVLAPGCT